MKTALLPSFEVYSFISPYLIHFEEQSGYWSGSQMTFSNIIDLADPAMALVHEADDPCSNSALPFFFSISKKSSAGSIALEKVIRLPD